MLENFGEKWRAKRAAKKAHKHKMKMAKIRRKTEEGEASGSAGDDSTDEDNDDSGEQPDDSSMEELEMAEEHSLEMAELT
jgi:hypothetical protein